MYVDPIVEEVRRVREAHAARFDFDPQRIFADVKMLERQWSNRLVSFPPRPARNVQVAKSGNATGKKRS